MTKTLEVPYNFDPSLIDWFNLEENKKYKDNIEIMFMAPFFDDYWSAKRYYNPHPGHAGITNTPRERAIYEQHVSYIVDSQIPLAILFQNPEQLLTTELLEYYVNLGARNFIVNNDDTAALIKEYDKSLEVICSLTKKLSLKDYWEKDLSNFDKFVLYFPFGRSLTAMKQLPPQYKYVLLVNCTCGYICPGSHHWFAGCDAWGNEDVKGPCPSGQVEYKIKVLPDALEYFDDYVYNYKLQGREYTTDKIIEDMVQYTDRMMYGEYANRKVEIWEKYGGYEDYFEAATGNSPFLER